MTTQLRLLSPRSLTGLRLATVLLSAPLAGCGGGAKPKPEDKAKGRAGASTSSDGGSTSGAPSSGTCGAAAGGAGGDAVALTCDACPTQRQDGFMACVADRNVRPPPGDLESRIENCKAGVVEAYNSCLDTCSRNAAR